MLGLGGRIGGVASRRLRTCAGQLQVVGDEAAIPGKRRHIEIARRAGGGSAEQTIQSHAATRNPLCTTLLVLGLDPLLRDAPAPQPRRSKSLACGWQMG